MDTSSSRLRELDSLRGIAALGVVFWHYASGFGAAPLRNLFAPFYAAGFYAVDFFFVLSGLVLARAYLKEPRRRDLGGNLVRRIARIYPLHLVTLLFVAVGQFFVVAPDERTQLLIEFNDPFHLFLNLTLTQFLGFQEGFSFNLPSWSISTEFYVNVLFFVLLATGRRLDGVFVALVAGSFLVITATGDGRLDQAGSILFVQVAVVRTVLGFFTGVLLHEIVFRQSSATRPPAWQPIVFDGVFVAVLALILVSGAGLLGTVRYFDAMTVLFGFPLLIAAAARSRLVKAVLNLKPFTNLGDVSYSIYLIHFPVQLLFFIVTSRGLVSIDYDDPRTLVGFFLLTIALSEASYRYVERPLQDGINARWSRRRRVEEPNDRA